MSLTLYLHPLSSFCQKVLIALYENETAFEPKVVDLMDEGERAEFLKIQPLGKFPVLRDEARGLTIPESSVIIEYLALHYPGNVELVPEDAELAWKVRLADRFHDQYVMEPMQKIVGDRLRPEGKQDPFGVEQAKARLGTAYGLIEKEMASKPWAAGEAFSMADCAAAPALFYANKVLPFEENYKNVRAYFERLMVRPSYARVLHEAQPYLSMFRNSREGLPVSFAGCISSSPSAHRSEPPLRGVAVLGSDNQVTSLRGSWMAHAGLRNRLNRSVDARYDHVLGPANAPMTLVEYGSYACPHCRAANERIASVRDQFGDRLRYVFRHRPIPGNDLARRAAELVERTNDPMRFWDAHMELMSRSKNLTEEDLEAVAEALGLESEAPEAAEKAEHRARERVDADINSAKASGVLITPTFYINNRRYDGAWDESSFSDALRGRLGHRVVTAALDFASWGPSAGLLLLVATIMALFLTNSDQGPQFLAFWEQYLTLSLGEAKFGMSLLHWINDGLLTIFFLVVGLEIKREFTVGHLAERRSAALPVAAAIGGMIMPAALYLLVVPSGAWAHGWGVPIATDTAFAIALIVMMGRRVPIELRIFLTAAAIVDDIAAILVVAVFYSKELNLEYLAAAVALTGVLAMMSSVRMYRVPPYILVGVALWFCIMAGGLHATLAGVVLALFIPTLPPPNLRALMAQADTIMATEAQRSGEALRHGPSTPAMRALEAIHDRLESPADRLLRHAGTRSSYLVLPLFALANAGVVLSLDVITGHEPLMLAIIIGLVIGKPLGMISASALAVWLGVAVKPEAYSWRQLAGAGSLAGIGFTMSLFIAGQAFPVASDFAAAKIAVFTASVLAAVIGVTLLATAPSPSAQQSQRRRTEAAAAS